MEPGDLSIRRRRLKLTQEQLGGLFGVSGNTIARWERGEAFPAPLMLDKALTCVELEIALGENEFARLLTRLPTEEDLPQRIRPNRDRN